MLCEKIRELRIANGLTQVGFAQKLGVTKQCVSNWENNNIQPSIDMLMNVALFFGVSTDYLLEMDDRLTIDVDHLTTEERAHIQMLVDDIRKRKR